MTSSPTILVVQHEQAVLRAIEDSLHRIGYEAHGALSGVKALEWLDQHTDKKTILALVDLRLPGDPSGLRLGHHLASAYRIPYFYLARQPSDLQDPKVLESQPGGYILEPYADDELLASLTLATEALRERHKRLNPIVTPSTDTEAILVTDLNGRITYLNTMAEDLTGWNLAQATYLPYDQVFRLVDPNGKPLAHEPFARGKDPIQWNAGILSHHSGKQIAIRERTSSLTDGDGSLAGLHIAFVEESPFTATKAQPDPTLADPEDEKLSARRRSAIVDAISDPLFAMDQSWRVTFVNRQAEEHLGRPSEALIGRNFWEEFPDSVHTKHYHQYHRSVSEQIPHDFEFYHEIQGRWMEVHAYPYIEGLLVFLRDTTQRRRAQERASKLEKLESLGLLARGFAHDFNNLLTVLLGNVSFARHANPSEAGYRESLDAAKQATVQAQNLVQQLMTFAKGGVPITETVDVNQSVVRDVMSKRASQSHIDYQMALTEEPVCVEADQGQLRRLLENLVQNAEEGLLRGGTLKITTGLVAKDDPKRQEISANLDANTDYVVLEVHDSGEGIDKANLDKIFEPYFSTRTDANATGLGLTVCESIARSHNGFLTVESHPGRYTSARLYLPALRQRWQSNGPDAPQEDQRRTTNDPPRVLILDDEKPIRTLMTLTLKKDFEVVETEEGSQTVEVYKKAVDEGRRFDLVVMDLSIPNGMGGAEAIQQIRYVDPEVVAIVSSGYSDDPVMANYTEYGFSAVLPKPYEPASLRQLAHSLIQGGVTN